MTDLQTLALVLALIYGWECACWIQRGSIVFSTRWGRRWRLAAPGSLLGNHRGGFLPAHPLPPLGHIVTATQSRLSTSPDGILAFFPPPIDPDLCVAQSGTFIGFDDMSSIRAKGKSILINREKFLTTGTSPGALSLARHLRHLRDLPRDQRQQAIKRATQDRLAFKPARKRWLEFRKRTMKVRVLCNLLFVYLLVAAPFLVYYFGIRRSWIGIAIGLLFFTVTIALRAHAIHKELYPEADDDRFTLFITLLLSPPTTIRACDALSRPLLTDYDPLVAAKLFLTDEEFRTLTRDYWLSLQYPILPHWTPEQHNHQLTETSSRKLLLEILKETLSRHGVDPHALASPPKRLDDSILTYCPRCRAQFVTPEGPCPDCGHGIQLRPLSTRPNGASHPG